MDIFLLVLRLALAGVFFVSGIAKLADRAGSRESLRSFSVPDRLTSPLALVLPVAEIVVAVTLLFSTTALWGGAAGLTLFVVFTAAIGYQLLRGRTPDCHCFGSLSSGAISRRTVARNAVFAVIAATFIGLAQGDPGPGVLAWTGNLSATEAVLTEVVALLALITGAALWALVQLMGQNGRVLERLEALESRSADPVAPVAIARPERLNAGAGLPVGSVAPIVELPTLDGKSVSARDFADTGLPYLLVFTSPGCVACESLMPEISTWQNDFAHTLTTVVIGRGDPESYRLKSAQYDIRGILIQRNNEASQQFAVTKFPSAVMVDANGNIGSGLAQGGLAVRELVRSIIADRPARAEGTVAAPPPSPRPAPVPPPNGMGMPGLVLEDLNPSRV